MPNFKSVLQFLLTTVMVGILLTGCKKHSDETIDCGTGLMSYLTDGHSFKYSYYSMNVLDTFDLLIKNDVVAGQFQSLKIWSNGFSDTTYLKECMGFLISSDYSSMSNAEKTAKATTVAGESWPSSNGVGTYTIVEKNTSITVPAGTFLCDKIVYSEPGQQTYGYNYFNNSVGVVLTVGKYGGTSLLSKNY